VKRKPVELHTVHRPRAKQIYPKSSDSNVIASKVAWRIRSKPGTRFWRRLCPRFNNQLHLSG